MFCLKPRRFSLTFTRRCKPITEKQMDVMSGLCLTGRAGGARPNFTHFSKACLVALVLRWKPDFPAAPEERSGAAQVVSDLPFPPPAM